MASPYTEFVVAKYRKEKNNSQKKRERSGTGSISAHNQEETRILTLNSKTRYHENSFINYLMSFIPNQAYLDGEGGVSPKFLEKTLPETMPLEKIGFAAENIFPVFFKEHLDFKKVTELKISELMLMAK